MAADAVIVFDAEQVCRAGGTAVWRHCCLAALLFGGTAVGARVAETVLMGRDHRGDGLPEPF